MINCRFVGQIREFIADLQNLAIEKQAFKSAKHQAQSATHSRFELRG